MVSSIIWLKYVGPENETFLTAFAYIIIKCSIPIASESFIVPANGKQWLTVLNPGNFGCAPNPKQGILLSES